MPDYLGALSLLAAGIPALTAGDVSFQTRTDLVLVPVTITDRNGVAVSDVVRGQLRLLDDNEPRSVLFFERERSPLSVVLVTDTSASMASKTDGFRAALDNIAAAAGPLDEASLVTFSSRAQVLSGFTPDIQRIIALAAFTRPSGETALMDAIWLALKTAKRGNHARKALIIISDGGDNHSRHTVPELLGLARETDAQIYGIAIHEQTFSMAERSGSDLLKRLAESTGGLHFEIRDSRQLPEAAEKIAEATRNLYVIGFRPPEKNEGTQWRRIRVLQAERPARKLRINAKAGYFAAGNE